MPVRWLFLWHPKQGSVINNQTLKEISECIENFSGVKEGRMKAILTLYKPNLQEPSKNIEYPRDFLGISFMEEPKKYFFIIRSKKIIVEADTSILTIMGKLGSYRSKIAINFEGLRYKFGDFQMRLIKVVINQAGNWRGILMEIEYLPISSIENAKPIMEELFQMWREEIEKKVLPGQFIRVEPNFADYGLSDSYSWQHTAVQYATALPRVLASVRS